MFDELVVCVLLEQIVLEQIVLWRCVVHSAFLIPSPKRLAELHQLATRHKYRSEVVLINVKGRQIVGLPP